MGRIRTILGLVAALSLTACGGGPSGSDTLTLRVEVTSSGKSIPWTGSVDRPHGPRVDLNGTTPFSQDLPVQRCDFGGTCFGSADATASGPGSEILTLCLTVLESGTRQCASSNDPGIRFGDGRTATVLLFSVE
jgi:hypothetical protein